MNHELEKFLSVVENGSFSAAADISHVSQPALTAAVKSLENRLGAQLLVRNTRPLQLTDAGRLVFTTASRVRLELANLEDSLRNLRLGRDTRTTIGAIDSVAMRLLHSNLNTTGFDIHVDNSDRLLEEVRLGRIELAFITQPAVAPDSDLDISFIFNEPFSLVATPDAAKTAARELRDGRALDRFITYNAESNTFQRISAAAAARQLHLRIGFASTSPELMRQLVLKGEGVALLPSSLVADDVAAGRLRVVRGFTFSRPIALATRRGKQLSDLQQKLIGAIDRR